MVTRCSVLSLENCYENWRVNNSLQELGHGQVLVALSGSFKGYASKAMTGSFMRLRNCLNVFVLR